MVKADLEKIGVKVELKNFVPNVWYSENLRKGEFDVAILGSAPFIGEKDRGISFMFKSASVYPNGENYYQYKNTGVDSMIEELNSSNQDPKELFLKIQQAIANDAILLPLYQHVAGIMIAKDNIEGIKNNPCLAKPFWNIEEWSITK
jgi:ABC-type transport system substrate-binding protein